MKTEFKYVQDGNYVFYTARNHTKYYLEMCNDCDLHELYTGNYYLLSEDEYNLGHETTEWYYAIIHCAVLHHHEYRGIKCRDDKSGYYLCKRIPKSHDIDPARFPYISKREQKQRNIHEHLEGKLEVKRMVNHAVKCYGYIGGITL